MPRRKKVPLVTVDQVRAAVDGDEESNGITGPGEKTPSASGPDRLKSNLVTKTLRVQQVATWLLDGATSTDVTQKSIEKWEVSERTADRYIAAAREQIEAASAQELRSAATLALYRMTQLYFAALEGGDLKTALDVVKAQNRMLGLNAPEKFETKNVTDWNSMTVAEQLGHVANILEKANGVRVKN